MVDKLWKTIERGVAAYVGGTRVPITGRIRGSAPDVEHPWLAIEIKHRQSLPNWIRDAMDQAEKSRRGEQLPIVILHGKGDSIGDCYAIVKLKDFKEWFINDRGYEDDDGPRRDRSGVPTRTKLE